jgi:ATP-dependent RNA helicase RhlE
MASFSDFKLLKPLMQNIADLGYTTPTEIQSKSIPSLLSGRDLLGIAQTGSGKTASFSLPLIQKISKSLTEYQPKQVKALVLTPTRELAAQIEQSILGYSKGFSLKTKLVFGGVSRQVQIDAIEEGLDVLVATPGRLLDLYLNDCIDFSALEYFVLDEADSMLDLGFFEDVKRIISFLPEGKQTALFSATMPAPIEKLVLDILKSPCHVEVKPEEKTVRTIDQKLFFVDKNDRQYLLLSLLESPELKSVLLFCKTKYTADRLGEFFTTIPIASEVIHSNKTQGMRDTAMKRFRDGEVRVLIATDIAARGIDIDHIDTVINYNLPEDPSNYIHRVGRTARAGRSGLALTLCIESEVPLLKNIEDLIQLEIPRVIDQPFHADFSLTNPNTARQKKKATKSKKGSARSKNSKGRRR